MKFEVNLSYDFTKNSKTKLKMEKSDDDVLHF